MNCEDWPRNFVHARGPSLLKDVEENNSREVASKKGPVVEEFGGKIRVCHMIG